MSVQGARKVKAVLCRHIAAAAEVLQALRMRMERSLVGSGSSQQLARLRRRKRRPALQCVQTIFAWCDGYGQGHCRGPVQAAVRKAQV